MWRSDYNVLTQKRNYFTFKQRNFFIFKLIAFVDSFDSCLISVFDKCVRLKNRQRFGSRTKTQFMSRIHFWMNEPICTPFFRIFAEFKPTRCALLSEKTAILKFETEMETAEVSFIAKWVIYSIAWLSCLGLGWSDQKVGTRTQRVCTRRWRAERRLRRRERWRDKRWALEAATNRFASQR